MKTLLLMFVFLVIYTHVSVSNEWTFEVNPNSVRMFSSEKLQKPCYFLNTFLPKNMVNLSFFTGKSFIPPYKDSTVSNMKNTKRWPIFTIEKGGFPFIYSKEDLTSKTINQIDSTSIFIAAGYPILLQNGKKSKISKSFFSKRRCPRTAIGIHPNGSLIIYVTKRATLREVQTYLHAMGCTDAINFDGGSSTFLYLDGKKVFSSNKAKSYPNVLCWE